MRALLLLFFFFLAFAAEAVEPRRTVGRRFLMVIGENRGDDDDHALHFAETDARRMLEVFESIGGVKRDDGFALIGGTDALKLKLALDGMVERLRRESWGIRDQLILYVSSHAGDGQLHLNGTRFPIEKLREAVFAAPVGVAILILDTCQAGAALREKGLVPIGENPVRVEEPAELTGRVIIASSNEQGAAFESDELGGSFFSYHFEQALRGAADSARNGSVSLQDAIAYASARTQAGTFGSPAGTQKPVYEIVKLKGQGELMLSEPGRASSQLHIDVEAPGSFSISSRSGRLVHRIEKDPRPSLLALNPGDYLLQWNDFGGTREASFRVADGAAAHVTERDLVRQGKRPLRSKGASADWRLEVAAGASSSAIAGFPAMPTAASTLTRSFASGPWGTRPLLQVALSYRQAHASYGVPQFEREVELTAGAGLSEPLPFGALSLVAQGGAVFVRQDHLRGGGGAFGAEPHLAVQVRASFPLTPLIALAAAGSPGITLVNDDTGMRPRFSIAGTAGVEFDFQ
jgi:hypothetical protein